MPKLRKYEVGEISLRLLQVKISEKGIDLDPQKFREHLMNEAKMIGCSVEELTNFYNTFLVPVVLRSCGMSAELFEGTPTSREGQLAFSILGRRFFWNLYGLRNEIYHLQNKTTFGFHNIAAVVLHIVHEHERLQFGEGEAVQLQMVDNMPRLDELYISPPAV